MLTKRNLPKKFKPQVCFSLPTFLLRCLFSSSPNCKSRSPVGSWGGRWRDIDRWRSARWRRRRGRRRWPARCPPSCRWSPGGRNDSSWPFGFFLSAFSSLLLQLKTINEHHHIMLSLRFMKCTNPWSWCFIINKALSFT